MAQGMTSDSLAQANALCGMTYGRTDGALVEMMPPACRKRSSNFGGWPRCDVIAASGVES
jgi:hypothetical protein